METDLWQKCHLRFQTFPTTWVGLIKLNLKDFRWSILRAIQRYIYEWNAFERNKVFADSCNSKEWNNPESRVATVALCNGWRDLLTPRLVHRLAGIESTNRIILLRQSKNLRSEREVKVWRLPAERRRLRIPAPPPNGTWRRSRQHLLPVKMFVMMGKHKWIHLSSQVGNRKPLSDNGTTRSR